MSVVKFSQYRRFQDSSDIIEDTMHLRERMRSAGYLFFRNVIPREDVLRLFAKMATYAKEAGWLVSAEPINACVANVAGACVDPEPRYLAVVEKFNKLYEFNALCHHDGLLGLITRLLGGQVLVHPKPLPRILFPALEEFTTPAHQDYPNIQGTKEVYTAWIALTDCTEELGGLEIAEGSHRQGVYPFGIANGAGGIEIENPLTGRWVRDDVNVGDVLLFHSMTVHRGIPNRSEKLRMSIDARYQLVSESFNPDNAVAPYGLPATWEELYENWTASQREHLAFYWRNFDLKLKPFDPRWFDQRDALAFALGEKGDVRARSVLLRIVARDKSIEKRERARRLLDTLEER